MSLGIDQLVALLYCIAILCGCGMAVMVGDSIRTDLQNRRAWRDHDDAYDAESALWLDWPEVCAMLGQPDDRTPVYDALVRERIERHRREAS